MIVWRIAREPHQALDGEGARLFGGRWNSEGVAVVYTSATLSLAALEYLVHVDPADAPQDLVALRIAVPDGLAVEDVGVAELPAEWNHLPDHPECIRRGDEWARAGRAVLLRVPSAIVPEEQNVLLNPAHADFERIAVIGTRRFQFDPRLLG